MVMRALILSLWACLLWPAAFVLATDLDGWRLMELSPRDQLAVFRSPDGELKLLKPGDRLGEKMVLTGFDGERVVLEKPGEWGRVTLFVSLVAGRQSISSRERQPLRKAEFSGDPTSIVTDPEPVPPGETKQSVEQSRSHMSRSP